METSAIPPNSPNLRVDEEALVSQVLDIIGGITPEPFNMLGDTMDKDVWSLEEGDDSVFYSDEEQPKCPHPIDSRLAGEPQTEQETKGTEGEHQNHQTAKTEQMSASDPGEAEREPTPGKSERTCEDFLQSNEEKTQPEQKMLAGKVNHTEIEEVVPHAQTTNLKLFEAFNEESFTCPNVEAELTKQLPGSPQLKKSDDRQLQVDRDVEQMAQDLGFHVHGGFHQNVSAGYSSTLSVMKKPGCYQKAFNHLTSSKYSTVSYRRIRRGNTRQKIEEFEHLMMNQ